jgi:hypothetical protein
MRRVLVGNPWDQPTYLVLVWHICLGLRLGSIKRIAHVFTACLLFFFNFWVKVLLFVTVFVVSWGGVVFKELRY